MSSSPEAHNGTMIQPNNPYRQPHAPCRTQWQARRAQPPSAAPSLPLMRPRNGRVLVGVCRGVSLHLGAPVWLVRLAFAAAALAFGAGVIAYVFLWMFMPVGDPVAAAQAMSDAASTGFAEPLSRGNAAYAGTAGDSGRSDADDSSEGLAAALRRAPKPSLVALAGLVFIAISVLLSFAGGRELIVPLAVAVGGLGLAWSRFDADEGKLPSMLGGIVLLFVGYAIFVFTSTVPGWGASPRRIIIGGFVLLAGTALAIVPWVSTLIRSLSTERALKEREEERADMTAHLHDGVLQTLALIQLHSDDPQTVFSLARQQERELREWLYQERTTSDRSVSAGLKAIAAQTEDEHGKPIEVVTVGDARPSAQTDALLDATQQALINAVTHGGEPISVYCEAGADKVEVFVRDHGDGFDVNAIPEGRLGIRESIIGRIRRRGGTVEIVSRPHWGTEVRMHMPVAGGRQPNQRGDATNAGGQHGRPPSGAASYTRTQRET